MPDEQPVMQNQTVTAFREEFSGPLPHPSILQGFDHVVPGAAERILQMAERQAAHRMELEKAVIISDIKKSERGQSFGLVVAVGGLVAAFVLGLYGHDLAAGIIGGGD